MPNVYFHGIGGTPDHLHIASSFYPPFEIDRWIGDLKGARSNEFGKSLYWQFGYGIVSFGTKDIPWWSPIFEMKKNITGRDRFTRG